MDKNFHLIGQIELPDKSFYNPNNPKTKRDVRSNAQVWVRKDSMRAPNKRRQKTKYFEARINYKDNMPVPLIALNRKGNIGTIATKEEIEQNPDKIVKWNWLFIYPTKGMEQQVIDAVNSIDWSQFAKSGMGQPEINKTQLINAIEKHLK